MQPVTVFDIAAFIQEVAAAFSDTLFMAFTLLLALTVAFGIKRLFLEQ